MVRVLCCDTWRGNLHKEQEMEALRGQAEFLKQALDDISKRLGELEKES